MAKIGEAAKYAGYSVASIRRFVKAGKLKHARVSGRGSLRFRTAWLDEFLGNPLASKDDLIQVQKTTPVADAVDRLGKRRNAAKSEKASKGHPALASLRAVLKDSK